jgi:hypothetical protein
MRASLRRRFSLPACDLLHDATHRRLWTSIRVSSLGGQVTLLALPLAAAVLLQAAPTQMGWLYVVAFVIGCVSAAILRGIRDLAAIVVQILFATRTLGLSEQAVGLCYAGLGVGTVAASAFGHRISRRIGPGPCLVLLMLAAGAHPAIRGVRSLPQPPPATPPAAAGEGAIG